MFIVGVAPALPPAGLSNCKVVAAGVFHFSFGPIVA